MSKMRMRKSKSAATTFSERLKSLRFQKSLSQLELANLIGITKAHFGRYERGQSMPNSDVLQQIARQLGVSTDYLLGRSEELQSAATSQIEDRELLVQFQEVQKLPEQDRFIIKQVVDAFLLRKRIQALTS